MDVFNVQRTFRNNVLMGMLAKHFLELSWENLSILPSLKIVPKMYYGSYANISVHSQLQKKKKKGEYGI